MFYDTNLNNHGLKHNPFKSCVVPRPIAWISTISENSTINLAPYSYFNAVSDIPPVIMFSSGKKPDGESKDSIQNIIKTKEFVVNVCSYDCRFKINDSSQFLPYGVSEAEKFDIELAESNIVKVPRVRLAKIALECKLVKTESLVVDGDVISGEVVFGHVIGIYIDDLIIEDGKVSIEKLKPISRLGYDEYAMIDNIFKMNRS